MTDLRLPEWEMTIGGVDYKVQAAVCERFSLDVEDHGLFTADVAFGGGSFHQGLGCRALDAYDEAHGRRVGTAFGMDFVMECCRILGSPEQAKGRRVVLFREKSYGLISGFAALSDDGSIGEPFFPDRLAEKHFPQVTA